MTRRPDEPRREAHGGKGWRHLASAALVGVFLLAVGLAIAYDAHAYAIHAPDRTGALTWLGNRFLSLGFLIPAAAFVVTGRVIVSRRSRNTVGWTMLLAGTSLGISGLVSAYATNALAGASQPPLLGVLANVVEFPTATLGFLLGLVFVPLLFPKGTLPSRRWRMVAWAAGSIVMLDTVRSLFTPRLEGSVHFLDRGSVEVFNVANPLAVPWMTPLTSLVSAVGALATLGLVLAAVAAVIVRFRRSSGIERQQMKWFVFAASMVAVLVLMIAVGATLGAFGGMQATLGIAVTSAYPVAIGVAVLRYRLYEIDRIISRTVSYGLVIAILGAVYVGAVVGLGAVATALTGAEDSDLVVALSTLLAAGLFQPVRNRVQVAVDRRFNRTGYEARQAVDAFARNVRDEVDLGRIRRQTAEAAAVAVQPDHASLWLAEDVG